MDRLAAAALQTLLAAAAVEGAVFPAVSDLPGGLSAAAFKRRFGDIDSPAYRAVLELIDRRIAALPAHAG